VGVLGGLVGVPDVAHLLRGCGTRWLQHRGLREAEGDWLLHLPHRQAARRLAQGHAYVRSLKPSRGIWHKKRLVDRDDRDGALQDGYGIGVASEAVVDGS
jgi:hypothetical protein